MKKVLDRKSCERFYRLRDALADYAYEKLDITSKLYVGKGKKYSTENSYFEDTLAETLDELWKTPDILKSFISENPAGLNAEDLATLKTWECSVQGWFTLFKHKGRLLFLHNKVLFDVSGLWDEIETVLKKADFPMMIQTTLLPFEGRIVYHGFMSHFPIDFGKGMRDMLDDEIKEALRDQQIISSSDELIRIAPGIREREEKERAEQVRKESELAKEGKKQMQGFHKGILAGMPEEEREEAIRDYLRSDLEDETRDYAIDFLKAHVTKGSATRDLRKLLATEHKEILQRWAFILEAEVPGKGNKPDLIEGLLPVLKSNAFLPELTLRAGLDLRQLDAYRRLYEEGGLQEFRENEIKGLLGMPAAIRLLCYSFYTKGTSKGGGKFTFVIPDDIMGVLDGLDWDEIREHTAHCEAAADIADAAVELRGIVKVDDAFEDFCNFYPSALTRAEFEGAVTDAIRDDRIGCVWFEADDGSDYLLNFGIADYYRETENPAGEYAYAEEYDEGYDDLYDSYIKGSLKPLENILDQQKGKKIRPLEKGMLSSGELYDWKCARPAVRALRDYLDNHVPDSQDDFFYADGVIEELIEYMTFGLMRGGDSVNHWLEILEDHDYIPNEAHLNRVIGLLMNMYNSMPNWLNNGWAPNELADIKLGRKSFYNEDGSRMKIGRNDPCPCGSGKKYKNCCGRK